MMRRRAASLRRIPGIVWLSLGGLSLRFLLAYGLFRGSGFKGDVATFVGWAEGLARHGPGGFYANVVADYLPGYLYVLWLIGSIGESLSRLLGGGTVSFGGNTYSLAFFFDAALLKLPPIAADALIGCLIYIVVRRWMAGRPGSERAALGAAALYVFNPVTWYDSALWGQLDAVGTLAMLGAIVLLVEGWGEGAVAATVVAAMIKPNYGVVLVPIVAVVLLRRHLFAVGSGPKVTLGMRFLPAALRLEQGPWRLVSSAAVGIGLLYVLVAPFGLDAASLSRKLNDAAGIFPYLSVNAYNPWALVGTGGHLPLALSDVVGPSVPPAATGEWSSDVLPLVGPIAAVTLGSLLLAIGFAVGVAQLAVRDSRRSILLVAAFLSLAFFILPTRVHERYAFPIFAILPLLAVGSRSFTIVTAAAAAAVLVNIHAVLTLPPLSTTDLTGLPFGEASRSFPVILASVVAVTAAFGVLLWRLRPAVDLVIDPVRRRLGMAPRPPDPDPFEPA